MPEPFVRIKFSFSNVLPHALPLYHIASLVTTPESYLSFLKVLLSSFCGSFPPVSCWYLPHHFRVGAAVVSQMATQSRTPCRFLHCQPHCCHSAAAYSSEATLRLGHVTLHLGDTPLALVSLLWFRFFFQ